MSDIVAFTRPQATADFIEAVDGALVYEVCTGLIESADGGHLLPSRCMRVRVPFEDTKGGRFGANERASLLRRWIRAALEEQDE